jgi:hypothetical protein
MNNQVNLLEDYNVVLNFFIFYFVRMKGIFELKKEEKVEWPTSTIIEQPINEKTEIG